MPRIYDTLLRHCAKFYSTYSPISLLSSDWSSSAQRLPIPGVGGFSSHTKVFPLPTTVQRLRQPLHSRSEPTILPLSRASTDPSIQSDFCLRAVVDRVVTMDPDSDGGVTKVSAYLGRTGTS